MQVHYDEGIANRIGPESCAGTREGVDAVQKAEGNTDGRVNASAPMTRRGRRPWHVQKLLVREPGDLTIDQQPCFACCSGPHREGEEP